MSQPSEVLRVTLCYALSFSLVVVSLVYVLQVPQRITGNPDGIVDEYYFQKAPIALLGDFCFVAAYLGISLLLMHMLRAKTLMAQTLVVGLTTGMLTASACLLFLSQPLNASFFSRWFHSVRFKSVFYDVLIVMAVFVGCQLLLRTRMFCTCATASAASPSDTSRVPPHTDTGEHSKMTETVKADFFRELCFGSDISKHDTRTSHGFKDLTHNMCCLLGPKSRSGADATAA